MRSIFAIDAFGGFMLPPSFAFTTHCPMVLTDYTSIAANIVSALAVLAGAAWFLYTDQFKPRLRFDVDCTFFPLKNSQHQLLEIQFIFENTGFVEHRLWNLNVSVHTLGGDGEPDSKPETLEVKFPTRLMPQKQLVPPHYEYYFVRPGVRQIITHTISIPADVEVIRVTSSFNYDKNEDYPHTVRRVFAAPGAEKACQG